MKYTIEELQKFSDSEINDAILKIKKVIIKK